MSDDKLSDDKRILKWTVDGERWVDGEWTDETIAEDKIGYYRYKDRGMIELVGELRAENERLCEIEQEWLMMWATLEELNLVADVRKNMTEHGFTFPTDEDVIE